MRKTKEDAAITKDALFKSALIVFSEKGFSATTLEDIAKQAGVTRGAIYWHFGSKLELYKALLVRFSARSSEIVQKAALEGGSLVEILERVFIRLLEIVESDFDTRSLMEISLFKTEKIGKLNDIQQNQVETTNLLIKSLTDVMQEGISSGQLRKDIDAPNMARTFLALQNGLIHLWLVDPEMFSLVECGHQAATVLLKGIRA
jgi:TetR/AcrR family transcriptional regulator, acrAB operon repressor